MINDLIVMIRMMMMIPDSIIIYTYTYGRGGVIPGTTQLTSCRVVPPNNQILDHSESPVPASKSAGISSVIAMSSCTVPII